MFSKPKTLTFEMDTADLSINEIAHLHHSFFVSKDYDWWYEVLPEDIVVDIGAGIGMFSAKAYDNGAKRTYMIEPSRKLLETAVKNLAGAYIDRPDAYERCRIKAVHAAMGRTDVDCSNVHGEPQYDGKLMSLMEFVDYYDVPNISFLKISACGAEYNILHEDNLNFIATNVRHTACRVYLNAQYGGAEKFKHWRDSVLKPLMDLNRIYFQDDSYHQKVMEDNFAELLPASFMVYIKNW